MSDFSPTKALNGNGAMAEAKAADDALEEDPVTTIEETPNDQLEQRDKEALAQGLFHLFKPAIDNIDGKVKSVRQSQVELRAHIDNLAEDLRRISDCRVVPIDLDPYIKKLLNTRRRILAVANLLQTVQDRVNKVNYYVTRDKTKKNQMIKASTTLLIEKKASSRDDNAAVAAAAQNTSGKNEIDSPYEPNRDKGKEKTDSAKLDDDSAAGT